MKQLIKVLTYFVMLNIIAFAIFAGNWCSYKLHPTYTEEVEENYVPFTELKGKYIIQPDKIYYKQDTYIIEKWAGKFPFVEQNKQLVKSEIISR